MRPDDNHDDQGGSTLSVPLAEEVASIGVKDVVTGRVRVTTRVETEEHLVETELNDDVVEIVRVPVDRVVETVPAIRHEGDVTIVPIVEEVAVVEKRLVLREELHLHRRTERRTVSVPVSLRRQKADVERGPAPNPNHEEDSTP